MDLPYAYSPQVKPQTTSGHCPLQALGQIMCKIYMNPTMLVVWTFAEQDLDGCQILGLQTTQVHTELQPVLQLKVVRRRNLVCRLVFQRAFKWKHPTLC